MKAIGSRDDARKVEYYIPLSRSPRVSLRRRAVYDICRLQTADRRPQTADRRLQAADCKSQIADCKLNDTKNVPNKAR